MPTPQFSGIRIIEGSFLNVERRYRKLRDTEKLAEPHIAALPTSGFPLLSNYQAVLIDGQDAVNFVNQHYPNSELPEEYMERVTEHRGKMLLRGLLVVPLLYDTCRWFFDNATLGIRAREFAWQPENENRVIRERVYWLKPAKVVSGLKSDG